MDTTILEGFERIALAADVALVSDPDEYVPTTHDRALARLAADPAGYTDADIEAVLFG